MGSTTNTAFLQRQRWLGETYAEKGLVLVLGAGISVESGVPTWHELLRIAMATIAPEDGRELFEALCRDGWSLPTIASAIERRVGGRGVFMRLLRASLYQNVPGIYVDPDHYTYRLDADAFLKGTEANDTLRAVAEFCVIKSNGEYRPNHRVRSVVSLNLDALLQVYIKLKYSRRLLRTIERASATRSVRKVNVYHVHGFLTFQPEAIGKPDKEAPDLRVLTESEYFDFYNQPNSIFTYTFLHFLRDWNCLFVGLSMRDENVRRMLYYSYSERVTSLRQEDVEEAEAHRRSIRHFAVLKKPGHDQLERCIDDDLLRLGVRALWLDDFGQLPDLLRQVYQCATPLHP